MSFEPMSLARYQGRTVLVLSAGTTLAVIWEFGSERRPVPLDELEPVGPAHCDTLNRREEIDCERDSHKSWYANRRAG